jgi:hypothetical protein
LFKSGGSVTDRYDDTCLPQDPRRLGEVRQLRSHCDLTHGDVGRTQEPFDEVGIGVAKKVGIVCSAVLAGKERALEVEPKNRGVSPGLRRRNMKLGDQNVGRSRDQRKQLTSNAMLAVEPPCRTDGLAAFTVRDAAAAVVVDVDQPWGEDATRAVYDIGLISDELTPAAAAPDGEDPPVFECDESVSAV